MKFQENVTQERQNEEIKEKILDVINRYFRGSKGYFCSELELPKSGVYELLSPGYSKKPHVSRLEQIQERVQAYVLSEYGENLSLRLIDTEEGQTDGAGELSEIEAETWVKESLGRLLREGLSGKFLIEDQPQTALYRTRPDLLLSKCVNALRVHTGIEYFAIEVKVLSDAGSLTSFLQQVALYRAKFKLSVLKNPAITSIKFCLIVFISRRLAKKFEQDLTELQEVDVFDDFLLIDQIDYKDSQGLLSEKLVKFLV